jgi:hypothetical protein
MYKNTGFPTQRTVNSKVDDGKQPIDLKYIRRQENIIKSQNQPYQGHIEPHLEPVPSENILQQVRHNVDAPSTRFNQNKLPKTKNLVPGKGDDLQASEIFSGPNQNYDPYIDNLARRGLLNDNYKSRVNTKYINIDSRGRSVEPTITKEDLILLEDDALFYPKLSTNNVFSTEPESLLNINITNHNFEVDDKVTITGIESDKFQIRALYDYSNSGTLTEPYYYTVIFQENSSSLIIKTDFDTSLTFNTVTGSYDIEDTDESVINQFQSFDPNFRVGDGIQYQTLANYDTSDMSVMLSGFDINNTVDFIGNVPVNFLNSTHRVHFINPDGTNNLYINVPDGTGKVNKITGFYIELPFAFKASTDNKNPLPKDIYGNMVIDINFKYIGGIAINALNSDIPITSANINGYQTVVATTRDTISIRLKKNTYYIEPTPLNNPEIGERPVFFGGSNVFISKITEIIGGNNNPNNYTIELPESINNVFMIQLKNTIFPKTSKVFQKLKNNKIYWQNLSDGDIVYEVEVDEGSYSTEELAAELERKMYEVTRTNVDESSVNEFTYTAGNTKGYDSDLNTHLGEITACYLDTISRTVNKGGYTNKVLFKISIDRATSITIFQSYRQADLRRPIIKITDSIGNVFNSSTTDFECYVPPFTIKIAHPKHGLQIGDQILFSGFIETLGIPADILNTTHTISTISSDDTYEILIDRFNLLSTQNNTYGGYTATIFVQNDFRLLFNKSDTMGVQLGFRNVGSNLAITKYGTIITNQQAYQDEVVTTDEELNISYVTDSIGNQIVLTNNALQFRGENYVHLAIREFAGSTNISQNKQLIEYFAKINLSEKEDKTVYNPYVYDTFISAPVLFYDMKNLHQISIRLYGSDGQLYNFNGVDHSFILEITSLDNLPQQTNINSTNSII